MGGLVESIGSNKWVQQIVMCWFAPVLIGAFAFVIVVLPDVRTSAVAIYLATAVKTLHVNKFLFVFVASLAVATLMFVNRLPLWRVLEGYSWPIRLIRWRVDRAHAPQARWLRAKLAYEQACQYAIDVQHNLEKAHQVGAANLQQLRQDLAEAKELESEWSNRLAKDEANRKRRGRRNHPQGNRPHGLSRLPRRSKPLFTLGRPNSSDGEWIVPYPSDDRRLMPTKLGNIMRSMETYGAEKYGLDSQIMWFELLDVAPASLLSALEGVELEADALVCGIYSALALAAAALASAAWRASIGADDTKLWVAGVVSIALSAMLYGCLQSTAGNWAFAVKSLVDGSRDLLRQKYGLRVPNSASDEKQMWDALVGSRWYDDPERVRVLARYRSSEAGPVEVGNRRKPRFVRGGWLLFLYDRSRRRKPGPHVSRTGR